jgi:hypothetical protein
MNSQYILPIGVALSAAAVVFSTGLPALHAEQQSKAPLKTTGTVGKYVDKDGAIRLPDDYRLKWVHLGSWYDEDGKGGPGSMHDVYAEPEAVTAYRAEGKWPQGATIVKEIRASRSGKLSTGQAHWDGEISQWFVMVKDANRTFPDNPSWGRGWGWALFKSDQPAKNVSTDYKVDCLGCHVPARSTDWIYTHGYPILAEKDGPFKTYPAAIYDPPSQE